MEDWRGQWQKLCTVLEPRESGLGFLDGSIVGSRSASASLVTWRLAFGGIGGQLELERFNLFLVT